MTQFTSDNAKAMQAKSVESRNHRKALQKELLKDGDKVLKELLNHDIDMSGLTIDSSVLADVYKDMLLTKLRHNNAIELLILKNELDELKNQETEPTSNVKTLTEPMDIWKAIDEGLIVLNDDDKKALRLWAQ
ncbi:MULTISPECIES: hypothetical protein [Vibrio]|uniref:hypothetical protein n=1 Tax=Vibrio TaxID=662 RepID=UPI000C855D5E|nr:hypothetical protein [Vibrio breoganii]PMP03099.1 hypothetical protein BCS95_09015 [Vibrio breoganii]